MEFVFETRYDQKVMTAMARALRKTARKKRSHRALFLSSFVTVLGMFLLLSASAFNFRSLLTLTAVIAVLIVLIWQDNINGYLARKRVMPGLDKAVTTFREDGYHVTTAVGESEFPYSNIQMIVEDKDHFVFIFGTNHAQVYSKHGLAGGSAKEFGDFIADITGMQLIVV